MEPKRGNEGEIPVLPESSLPCVWMIAGLLTYRLCDRGYECERCPLDAAIRGVDLAPPAQGAGDAPVPSPAWGIRDDRRYHPAYGWVETLEDGRFRWGIDGLMARLLDRITSVVLPAPSTELQQGQIACWLLDDGELVPLREGRRPGPGSPRPPTGARARRVSWRSSTGPRSATFGVTRVWVPRRPTAECG
jgi:hypothetical protein